ncbi:TrbG/VirB9 family P-type conjugative transfer protein, partial [Kingella kingae]|uniref:TrbG/VirB9 family P-type conjugative transfer protein n=1 Tax=Kingella kingae TaxID=504 RepID=UPI0012BB6BFB
HSEAWTHAARGNNLIFKPKSAEPVTNMIIVSNKRTYAFDLKTTNGNPPPTYILRFDYPDTRQAKQAEQREKQAAQRAKQDRAFQTLTDSGAVHDVMSSNRLYFGQGSQKLAPTSMWDNGRFTYLKFNNGRDMPAIYRVEADGSETLLNTHIEQDTTVIHEVNEKIILRLGRAVLLIENRGFNPQGKFNHTGTDDNQSVCFIK